MSTQLAVPEQQEALSREFDFGALGRNLERIAAHLHDDTRVIASVKANGYGHGVVSVARALEAAGIDGVATASAAEALRVMDAGVRVPVILFGGQAPETLPPLAQRGVTVTVANLESAYALAAAPSADTGVFLKVDSGLGRLGVSAAEAHTVIHDILIPAGINLDGIYTHLPFADAGGERWARTGLESFRKLVVSLRAEGIDPPIVQALSSPGVSAGLPISGNAVCVGRLLYGLSPSIGSAAMWRLEPVLRKVVTHLVHVRTHAHETRIGSGGRSLVRAEVTTGVIPCGRSNGNMLDTGRAPVVLHGGKRVPVVSVSLEHATLDLGPNPSAAIGEEVTIVGGPLTVADFAAWSNLTTLDALVALDRGTAD
jgi:alanine racemase